MRREGRSATATARPKTAIRLPLPPKAEWSHRYGSPLIERGRPPSRPNGAKATAATRIGIAMRLFRPPKTGSSRPSASPRHPPGRFRNP